MSRTDASITVSCDKCGYEEQYGLCALAGRAWDDRHINGSLKRDGWRVDGDGDICASCVDEAAERESTDAGNG